MVALDSFFEVLDGYEDRTNERPDIIEFVTSDAYLNRPRIYPRQATLLKVIFLQSELLTPFDFDVLDEWASGFRLPDPDRIAALGPDDRLRYEGYNGIAPDVLDRIQILRQCPCGHDRSSHWADSGKCLSCLPDVCAKYRGYQWFGEVDAVIGRRGSKGFLGGLCGGYVLWHYILKGDPQEHYGVDRDKQLACFVFASKKDQAKVNQWKDLKDVITGGPCFSHLIPPGMPTAEQLKVWAPHDELRARELRSRGIIALPEPTFSVLPKESTLTAGRGPASFCLDPRTPVLTSRLEWYPIVSLLPGDRVIGIDEYPERRGAQRKLREAEVIAVRQTRKPAIRINFMDESEVICSRDHRWLVVDNGSGGARKWRGADHLNVGNRVCHLVDPWVEDRSFDAGYLAGVFDGEACVVEGKGAIQFAQNPGLVMDQAIVSLKELGFTPLPVGRRARCQHIQLRGMAENLRFLGQVRPRRLLAEAHRLWDGHAPRGGRTRGGRDRADAFKVIVSIEELPEQDLIDIETTTGTFVANGFISHNCQFYDEMAHVVREVATASAEEVYVAATPALDQFGKDGFIYAGSSPWQMMGQFYENYEQALAVDQETGLPEYPEKLTVQLTSWDPYKDWEQAHKIDRVPVSLKLSSYHVFGDGTGKKFPSFDHPIQTYDDRMRRLEKANPETFKVERRSRWAASLDAYLNPDKVDAMFGTWGDRLLTMQVAGKLSYTYVVHGDPSKSGANFGFAIAHLEGPDVRGLNHVVFDLVKAWRPQDFEPDEEGDIPQVDYIAIGEEIEGYISAFYPDQVTFDQWNSVQTIQRLKLYVHRTPLPKRCEVYERTATYEENWRVAETFKSALNMDLVHAPDHELGKQELKFLQEKNRRVDHPTSGPVQTKDVADCLMICTYALIGDQMAVFIRDALSSLGVGTSMQGGTTETMRRMAEQPHDPHSALSGLGGGRSGMSNAKASRGRAVPPTLNPRPGRVGRTPGVARSRRRR